MPHSMTGFASTQSRIDSVTLSCEIKTINQRFLDLSISLPDALKSLENGIAKRLDESIQRGKIICKIEQTQIEQSKHFDADAETIRQILKSGAEIEQMMRDEDRGAKPHPLSVYEVIKLAMNNEGNLSVSSDTFGISEKYAADVIALVDQTLAELLETRRSEGERLSRFVLDRCQQVRENLAEVRLRRPDVLAQAKDKLNKAMEKHALDLNAERLEQEIALIVQKQDIDEELDRLSLHLDEIVKVFERNEPIGRRLDFIMQELNRETNTLGAKTANIEDLNSVVEIKVLIEQMREQIQNIE